MFGAMDSQGCRAISYATPQIYHHDAAQRPRERWVCLKLAVFRPRTPFPPAMPFGVTKSSITELKALSKPPQLVADIGAATAMVLVNVGRRFPTEVAPIPSVSVATEMMQPEVQSRACWLPIRCSRFDESPADAERPGEQGCRY